MSTYSPAFSARTRVGRLSRLFMENGFIYFARSGFQRLVLRTRSSWSLLRGLNVYQSNAGNWSVWTLDLCSVSLIVVCQKCSVCDIREGACIQCSKNSCFLAYHVTCARKEKFLMPMKASSGLEPPPLQCFCEKHMPVRCDPTFRVPLLTAPQARKA
jgi:PHD-like zinc-binding domain